MLTFLGKKAEILVERDSPETLLNIITVIHVDVGEMVVNRL